MRRMPQSLCAVVVLLIGCASDDVGVGTAHDPLTVFPASATFAWARDANRLPTDERFANLDVGPLIEAVATEEFAAKGYRRVDSPNADYLLSYEVRIDWVRVETSETLGSLSLQLVETRSGRRVWTGYARAEIHPSLSAEQREARMRDAVGRMLEKFPPRT